MPRPIYWVLICTLGPHEGSPDSPTTFAMGRYKDDVPDFTEEFRATLPEDTSRTIVLRVAENRNLHGTFPECNETTYLLQVAPPADAPFFYPLDIVRAFGMIGWKPVSIDDLVRKFSNYHIVDRVA